MVEDRSLGQRLLDALKPDPEKVEKIRDAERREAKLRPPGHGQPGPDIQQPGQTSGFGNSKAGFTENQKKAHAEKRRAAGEALLNEVGIEKAPESPELKQEPEHKPYPDIVTDLEGPPSGRGRGGRRL